MAAEPTLSQETSQYTLTLPGKVTCSILAGHASEIRRLGKRVVADVIEIGRLLGECKRIAGRADFLPWLDHEFGWSEDTAERFIQLHALSNQIPQLAEFPIPLSGFYLLAAPSTPPEARDEIIGRAEADVPVSVADVKETIARAKGRFAPPARKPSAEHNDKDETTEKELALVEAGNTITLANTGPIHFWNRMFARMTPEARTEALAGIDPADLIAALTRLSSSQLVDLLERRLECDGIAVPAQLRKIRERIERSRPTVDLTAVHMAGSA